jgi:hypothetical protein
MQAQLSIECYQCLRHLGMVKVDTADMPEDLQHKINRVILRHRQDCRYYRQGDKKNGTIRAG